MLREAPYKPPPPGDGQLSPEEEEALRQVEQLPDAPPPNLDPAEIPFELPRKR